MTQVAGGDFVNVGPLKVAVWPEEIRLYRCEPAEDSIALIANPDIHRIQKPLIEKVLAKEAVERVRSPQTSRGEGGQKIRHLDKWTDRQGLQHRRQQREGEPGCREDPFAALGQAGIAHLVRPEPAGTRLPLRDRRLADQG